MTPQWKQELSETKEAAWLLQEALTAVLTDDAQRIAQATFDGMTHTVYLINPERAHGGLILYKQVESSPKQRSNPTVRVAYLEREFAELQRKIGASDYVNFLYELVGKVMQTARKFATA